MLPIRFKFPTPLEIPLSIIIPAPPPFFIPYIAPQLNRPKAFKLWVQTLSPLPWRESIYIKSSPIGQSLKSLIGLL
jgi:hypothetical protein